MGVVSQLQSKPLGTQKNSRRKINKKINRKINIFILIYSALQINPYKIVDYMISKEISIENNYTYYKVDKVTKDRL